jgi:hypothetical protein
MELEGKVYHFSQANPKGSERDIAKLLRRVAATIDEHKGSIIHDVVLNLAKNDEEEPSISVYYSYLINSKLPATEKRYQMRYFTLRSCLDPTPLELQALFEELHRKIEQLGKVDIYNMTSDNVIGKDGEYYSITVYYDHSS